MIGAADLAARLGLRAKGQRREWRGDCPSCGYRAGLAVKERDGRAVWWCASCRDGAALTAAVWRALGRDGAPPAPRDHASRQAPSTARKSALVRDLWDAALLLPGTIAECYLASRGLAGIRSDALRYLPNAPHPGGKRLPAMLAAIRNTLTGELQAVHRTYLRPDGSGKADAEPSRASLGPVAGGAVMLAEPGEAGPLVIGEGIETALSAAVMIGGTAWSAISAGNLTTLPLPALLPVVVIAADPDAPGQRAAAAAALRWRAEGRSVRIATPDEPDLDFNDLLRARHAARENSHG
jgi:putative DNA primase/helicase